MPETASDVGHQLCSSQVVIADRSQIVTHVNQAFTPVTGYTPQDTVGKKCNFLQGTETNQLAVQVISRLLFQAHGASFQTIRDALKREEPCRVALLNYKKSGEPFWNLLTISPLYGRDGKVSNYVGLQVLAAYLVPRAS